MPGIILNITDEEERILLSNMVDPEAWLNNCLDNKLRQVSDKLVLETSTYNPNKLNPSEKLTILKDKTWKTAAEKQVEFEASINK